MRLDTAFRAAHGRCRLGHVHVLPVTHQKRFALTGWQFHDLGFDLTQDLSPSGGIFKQIPGVSLAWRELSLTLPADADYAATKERLLGAAAHVLENYKEELERQTRELNKTSWGTTEEAQAQVQLRFAHDSIEAIVRYPVPLQRAGEVEERMSRALLEAARERGTAGQLTAQPA